MRSSVHAADAWTAPDALDREFATDPAPRSDEHAQRFRRAAAADGGDRGGDRRFAHAGDDLTAGASGDRHAFDADGQALAFDAVEERLGKRPDDRDRAVALAGVVQVPPDVIARSHAGARGRARALYAIDVVEPFAGRFAAADAPGAGRPADALHVGAVGADAHRVVATQQVEHSLVGARAQRTAAVQHTRAEVPRDEQLDGRWRRRRDEPAASEGERDQHHPHESQPCCSPSHPDGSLSTASFSRDRRLPHAASAPLSHAEAGASASARSR